MSVPVRELGQTLNSSHSSRARLASRSTGKQRGKRPCNGKDAQQHIRTSSIWTERCPYYEGGCTVVKSNKNCPVSSEQKTEFQNDNCNLTYPSANSRSLPAKEIFLPAMGLTLNEGIFGKVTVAIRQVTH